MCYTTAENRQKATSSVNRWIDRQANEEKQSGRRKKQNTSTDRLKDTIGKTSRQGPTGGRGIQGCESVGENEDLPWGVPFFSCIYFLLGVIWKKKHCKVASTEFSVRWLGVPTAPDPEGQPASPGSSSRQTERYKKDKRTDIQTDKELKYNQ